MNSEPERLPVLPADSVAHKAVEVGLITAQQLRDVLLGMSRTKADPDRVDQALVDQGLLSMVQLDALPGAPPKKVGKYAILRELGRGGMGVVYEAEDAGEVILGEPATGSLRILGSCPKPIRRMSWSPDGRWIATATADETLRLWDPATGKFTALNLENGYFCVTFSPKGDRLAAGGNEWSLRLRDLGGAKK